MPNFNVHITNSNLPEKTRVNLINTAISGVARYAGSGFCNFYTGPVLNPPVITDILVDAPGFAPYSYFGETGQLIIFGDKTLDIQVTLTPSFKKPSRDQIVNVKANLCNLFDSDGIPIFDIYLATLLMQGDTAKFNEWIDLLRSAGSTHINLALSYNYNEFLGWGNYPLPGMDFTDNLGDFSNIIIQIQNLGFIPIIKLATDGQSYDPNGWTYGWQWGMDNLPRILPVFNTFINDVLWSTGFDGCFPDWSRQQTIDMLQMLRGNLGSDACIDTEFNGPGTVGYCHMGNGPGDWTPDTLGILDNFSVELKTYPPSSIGIQQTASRLLGPQASNISPENMGPYFLREMSTIKNINICMYETIAFQAIRKQVDTAQIKSVNRFCANFGFSSFGNGLP